MAISRERAVDLSHRMVERLGKTPGVAVAAEREFLRNHILQAILAWDKENERITEAVKAKIARAGAARRRGHPRVGPPRRRGDGAGLRRPPDARRIVRPDAPRSWLAPLWQAI